MKKILKTSLLTGLTTLFLLLPAATAFAETNIINISPTGQFARLRHLTFGNITQSLITLGLVIAALVAFGFLIFGGIAWITSGGDKAKAESARSTITAALIGLLVVFGAWALINLLEAFFGVTILQLNISPVATGGTTTCASLCTGGHCAVSCPAGETNIGSPGCPTGQTCCCP